MGFADLLHDPEADNRFAEISHTFEGMVGQLATLRELMAKWLPREVLWSGTIQIPSNGVWTKDFQSGTRSLWIANYSADQMTVDAASQKESAPSYGVGVHQIPAGASLGCNGRTAVWSIYGTAGTQANVQIFDHTLDPAMGGGTGSATSIDGGVL